MLNDDDGDWIGNDFLDGLIIIGAVIMLLALTIMAYALWNM